MSEYIAGAIVGLVIIYVYMEIKQYLREEERKRKAAEFITKYDKYKKREDEFMRTHEEIPLTCGDDEYYLGSRFMMRKREDR